MEPRTEKNQFRTIVIDEKAHNVMGNVFCVDCTVQVRAQVVDLPYVVSWYVENQLANARNSNSRTKFYGRYKTRLRPDTHVTNLTYLPVKLVEEYLEPSKALLRQISTLRQKEEKHPG